MTHLQKLETIVGMNKTERLRRLCELGVKEINGTLTPVDSLEIASIQLIRQENGEIDEIFKTRQNTDSI